MTKSSLRYPIILFDWGDTVMYDHPEITTPMVEWETVEVVEGIADVLAYLHSSGRRIVLATSAEISDEGSDPWSPGTWWTRYIFRPYLLLQEYEPAKRRRILSPYFE